MAENINDDSLDNPIIPQAKNPSAEIISTNHNDIITPNQETENMEVHHHPNLHHKPKPWKEYILEYLMIVLAVTTGFFAESLREHISTNEKEKRNVINYI